MKVCTIQNKLPVRSTDNSAGLDLFCPENPEFIELENGVFRLPLGYYMEIPDGYVGLLTARSSYAKLLTCNVGVIDSDYRGEICLQFKVLSPDFDRTPHYLGLEGKKVAQLVIVPCFVGEIEPCDLPDLSKTERGTGGFGSTGK